MRPGLHVLVFEWHVLVNVCVNIWLLGGRAGCSSRWANLRLGLVQLDEVDLGLLVGRVAVRKGKSKK